MFPFFKVSKFDFAEGCGPIVVFGPLNLSASRNRKKYSHAIKQRTPDTDNSISKTPKYDLTAYSRSTSRRTPHEQFPVHHSTLIGNFTQSINSELWTFTTKWRGCPDKLFENIKNDCSSDPSPDCPGPTFFSKIGELPKLVSTYALKVAASKSLEGTQSTSMELASLAVIEYGGAPSHALKYRVLNLLLPPQVLPGVTSVLFH